MSTYDVRETTPAATAATATKAAVSRLHPRVRHVPAVVRSVQTAVGGALLRSPALVSARFAMHDARAQRRVNIDGLVNVLVSAVGQLSRPSYPAIEGAETFGGGKRARRGRFGKDLEAFENVAEGSDSFGVGDDRRRR